MRWDAAEHVEKKFVVDLDVWNPDSDLSIETAANLRENITDCSWNKTSIFVVLSAASHCECLSSSGLTVAHDGTVYTVYDRGNCFLATILKDVFLGSVVHQLVKFKLPGLSLIIDMTSMFVFWNRYFNSLKASLKCLNLHRAASRALYCFPQSLELVLFWLQP